MVSYFKSVKTQHWIINLPWRQSSHDTANFGILYPLEIYKTSCSWTRVALTCIFSMAPLFLAILLIELMPLAPLNESWVANWVFWLRCFLSALCISLSISILFTRLFQPRAFQRERVGWLLLLLRLDTSLASLPSQYTGLFQYRLQSFSAHQSGLLVWQAVQQLQLDGKTFSRTKYCVTNLVLFFRWLPFSASWSLCILLIWEGSSLYLELSR